MGVGIGGDYPVSSVITSEFAARRIRGRMMAAVFSAQGWGNRKSCRHAESIKPESRLTSSRIRYCRSYNRYCFQIKDCQRGGKPFTRGRPSMASHHRYWMCSRFHRSLLPIDHPRDPPIHP